jgi:uncharacterized membrane protein YeaQ/YmgE (transglycosylase-associated protein family)
MALAGIVLAAFSTTNIIVWIIIGLIAGFLATRVIRGPHFGIVGDIVIGLVGAFLAGLLLDFLVPGESLGIIGEIIAAFIGAVVLLLIFRLIARGGRGRRRRL